MSVINTSIYETSMPRRTIRCNLAMLVVLESYLEVGKLSLLLYES